MSRWILGALLLLSFSCATSRKEKPAKLNTYGKRPDAARPQDKSREVNFAPLLEQRVVSHSVYSDPPERDLMKRVLLGPNLTFEASRSSLDEPRVSGPANPGPGTPDLTDALGTPVEIAMSSALMSYLSSKGSVMLAPAVTRRFGWEWWCTKDWCPKTTWVERLLLLYSRKPDGKDAAINMSGRELRAEDLPTAAFAVRKLGSGFISVPVVVVMGANDTLEFRPRADGAQVSLCEANLKVAVPVVAFSAELVSMKDGRILARIEEERSPRITMPLKRTITSLSWEPVSDTGYTVYRNDQPHEGQYTYVRDWKQVNVECRAAVAAYNELAREAAQRLELQLRPTVMEIFKTTLDPLYR